MKKCVLLTGGAGFIGCEIAKRLPRDGMDIVAVDNLHPQVHPTQTRPAALPGDVILRVADVRDAAFWQAFFGEYEPEVIFHLAAETGTGQSLTESSRHASVNVSGTTEMLDGLSARNIRPKHIILSSSRAVYGEGAWQAKLGAPFYPGRRSHRQLVEACWDFTAPDGVPARPVPHMATTTVTQPTSVYGATKLAQEHILGAWTAAMDVPLSILRFQNVYGPGQSPFNSYTGIITLFHRQARAGNVIEIYEDGEIGRDFVFIDDVACACVKASANPPKDLVRCIDVGTGVPTTIMDVARIIARFHGAPEPVVCGKFRDGDVRWAVCNADAVRSLLGDSDFVGFEAGSKAVSDWLVENNYI